MGKSSKSARSAAKKAERHAIKAARAALYTSQSNSNKKQQRSGDGVERAMTRHAMANCGNPGCERCQPTLIPGWKRPGRN